MKKNSSIKKIGLFFGSFNPIHIGHLIIANYFVEYTDLDQIWFVISPHNPLKAKSTLLADNHRLAIVTRAIEENPRFKASSIEFKLPQPSYTIHTLVHLQEKYPTNNFVLIIGSDNLVSFHKWKNYEEILKHYQIYVYPRPGSEGSDLINHPSVKLVKAPLMEISSSFIRKSIKEKKDVNYFLSESVYAYVKEMHFYEK